MPRFAKGETGHFAFLVAVLYTRFMSTDILGLIFNSPARVKIMRLFLLNRENVFSSSQISKRSNVSNVMVRKEISVLSRSGFIKRKKEKQEGKMVDGWIFNPKFTHTNSLNTLLFGTEFVDNADLARRFRRSGRIKLLVLSGIFTHNPNIRIDLLLVGDNLKRPVIERIIRSLEAEIGKEISYAAFETEEFLYRASMYDKLIRDIIDFPHEKVINQGSLLEQIPQATI
ncbi:MAG: HTH domain-containing protein [bacterium]